MKTTSPKTKTAVAILATGLLISAPLVHAVSFDWASVGDANNVADNSSGYGAVDHNYRIAKHEVTIGQYAEFLNAAAKTDTTGLYNTSMGTDLRIAGISRSGSPGSYSYSVVGSGNRPITYVSWYDAARFVNWVENGQGAGDTESGVYALGGATSGIFTASGSSSHWLPTEDEWYKAAYYDPSKAEVDDGNNYHLHANQSDTLVDNSTSANYYDGDYVGSGSSSFPTGNALTDVGSYTGQESHYGTFDQGGNVWEWNDAVISGSSRGLRGGSWNGSGGFLRSSGRNKFGPSNEGGIVGFRIASVPEPSSVALLSLGSLSLLLRRRRG